MFLSDSAIGHALASGALKVGREGFCPPLRIQPSSVELHLGGQFRYWPTNGDYIDPAGPRGVPEMEQKSIPDDGAFVLGPQQFALGHTIEEVGVDATLAAQVDGKSSLARIGLQVHMTSGFIDPGFHGQITLEFFNATNKPIHLRPGMLIAQLFVIPMWGPVERPYGSDGVDSRYQGQEGATSSRFGREAKVVQPGCIKSHPHMGSCGPFARDDSEPVKVASCCNTSLVTKGKRHTDYCPNLGGPGICAQCGHDAHGTQFCRTKFGSDKVSALCNCGMAEGPNSVKIKPGVAVVGGVTYREAVEACCLTYVETMGLAHADTCGIYLDVVAKAEREARVAKAESEWIAGPQPDEADLLLCKGCGRVTNSKSGHICVEPSVKAPYGRCKICGLLRDSNRLHTCVMR